MYDIIESSWKQVLADVLTSQNFQSLIEKINQYYTNDTVYPKQSDVFRAFNLCPFSQVRVVILGQDPYHGEGQANGLAFSVHSGMKIPPSLQNIFKEIKSDIDIEPILDGDLSRWANQGVLLLNSCLTVQRGQPGSHQDLGWQYFTDQVIKKISNDKEHVVFILWGNYAKSKSILIDTAKHLVIESNHPSPFSAYRGFFGSKPFSKTNNYLKRYKQAIISWR